MKIQKFVFPILGCSAVVAIICLAATGSSGYRLQHKYKISVNGAGQITNTVTTARQIQFALKFLF